MRCERMGAEAEKAGVLGGPRSFFVYIEHLVCRIAC